MIYARRSTALHAARPAVTIAWAAALTFAVIACPHPAALAVLAVGVPAIAWRAQVPRPVLIASAIAVPFGLLWVLTNMLLVRDGLTVIARLGELPPLGQLDITLEATVLGATLALRALVALQAGILLSSVVDPDRLLVGLRRIAPRAGLTGALALRLAPALADAGRRYAEGLRQRADGGNLGGRERVLVLSATVGRAIDRAATVSSVLELRGMSGAGRVPRAAARTRRRWSRHDWSTAASALAILALTVAALAQDVVRFETYPQISSAAAGPAALWALAVVAVAAAPLLATRGTEPPR